MGTQEDRPYSREAIEDENEPEQPQTPTEGAGDVAVPNLETQKQRRKTVWCLLQVFALQFALFGLLACFVHVHPILPLDVAITHALQQNQAPWLYRAMLAISYPGSSPLLPINDSV